MSRVLVVTSSPAFAEGGHLVMARSLVASLQQAGHDAALMVTPQNRFGRHTSTYLASWLADVQLDNEGRRIDRVISLRFASYAVRHPVHVCWLNHRLREYYDLWQRFSGPLSWEARVKERVRRRLIHAVDHYLLTRNVRRVFALSRTVQARLEQFGRIPSEVLHPPAPPRAYRCEDYGDYILAVSRLTPLKRLDLLLRAVARPESEKARLVVIGDGDQAGALRDLAAELGIGDRVRFEGAVDAEQLTGHLARCRAVCFPPFNEDYGFVTVEAFASRKPVVTCTDSGGPTELVHDGVEGLVCAPTAEAIANSLARLMADRCLSERMGEAGYRVAASMTWERAVRTLLLV